MTDAPPVPTMEFVMREVVGPVMNGTPLRPEDDFFEADLSSVKVVQMVSRCQVLFGVEVSMLELFDDPNVEAIVRILLRELAPPSH